MAVAPRALGTLAVAGVVCVAYGALIERRWYRLRHVSLPGALRTDPTGATQVRPSLRILHVSDIHLDPPQEHKVTFLRQVGQQIDADLVVATGDLLGAVGAEDAAATALGALTVNGAPGVAVLGSNDLFGPVPKNPLRYFLDDRPASEDAARDGHGDTGARRRLPRRHHTGPRLDTARLVARLAEHGIVTLRNQRAEVATRAGVVAVGAIDDPHLATTAIPPVDELRPRRDDAVLNLGVVHAPYRAALDRLVESGHQLLLSGHTHGGQVRFPPIGAVVANCDLPLGRVRGASRYGGGWLHVSPGLGTSRYAPFRFACRPEVTALTLTA